MSCNRPTLCYSVAYPGHVQVHEEQGGGADQRGQACLQHWEPNSGQTVAQALLHACGLRARLHACSRCAGFVEVVGNVGGNVHAEPDGHDGGARK